MGNLSKDAYLTKEIRAEERLFEEIEKMEELGFTEDQISKITTIWNLRHILHCDMPKRAREIANEESGQKTEKRYETLAECLGHEMPHPEEWPYFCDYEYGIFELVPEASSFDEHCENCEDWWLEELDTLTSKAEDYLHRLDAQYGLHLAPKFRRIF